MKKKMNGFLRFFCLGVMFLATSFSYAEAEETQAVTSQSSAEIVGGKHLGSSEELEKNEKQEAIQQRLKLKDPKKSFGDNGFCINCQEDKTSAIFEEWVKSPMQGRVSGVRIVMSVHKEIRILLNM